MSTFPCSRAEPPVSPLAEQLRERVFALLPRLAQGFLTDRRDRLGITIRPTEPELADLFEAMLTLLYRLLFLLHAEGRDLLPLRLKRITEEVLARAGAVEADASCRLEKAYAATEGLYDRVMKVPTCADLFLTPSTARFLSWYKVPDRFLAVALDNLARAIDYRSLPVRHLGSLHEELRECKLTLAGGGGATEVRLTRDRFGRRASGSYYTPDAIVEYIVAHTVGAVLDRKLEALRPRLRGGAPGRVEHLFDLKVLDPAMGSGHFLVAAAHCITDRLRRFLDTLPNNPCADVARLRLHVLKRCIHGVDRDPMAAELARVSLWLDACTPGVPLRFLDDHLRCGDSLRDPHVADLHGPHAAGFDVVLGNPPYDVLAGKELNLDLGEALAYFRREPLFAPAHGGKMNLYKLFICLGVHLLAEGGRLGYIVPMALLGDRQAAGVRKLLVRDTTLVAVEAFPQKDDPRRRVFRDAKLSTCVFIAARSEDAPLRCRIHPGKTLDEDSPALRLHRSAVELYDSDNQPIVACSQEDWDLVEKILESGRIKRLGEYARAYQGEVNEKTDGDRGHLSSAPADGPLVLRGANICRYALRAASQGEPIYLRQDRFLEGKRAGAKAWHFQQNRAGFQRSAPQNNFRRLIACLIPAGRFCCDTVSYFPEEESVLPLTVLIAVFNSKLLDWYFRLGSTGSKVNDYQVRNLPIPAFAIPSGKNPEPPGFARRIARLQMEDAFRLIEPLMEGPPFPGSLMTCMARLVIRIAKIEAARGAIARGDRSALDPRAQPYQEFLDRMLYRLAGLSDAEASGLERRLARML